MIATYGAGITLHLRRKRKDPADVFGPVEGSLLGLLALLLAFTFSMSATRYDARRSIAVERQTSSARRYFELTSTAKRNENFFERISKSISKPGSRTTAWDSTKKTQGQYCEIQRYLGQVMEPRRRAGHTARISFPQIR